MPDCNVLHAAGELEIAADAVEPVVVVAAPFVAVVPDAVVASVDVVVGEVDAALFVGLVVEERFAVIVAHAETRVDAAEYAAVIDDCTQTLPAGMKEPLMCGCFQMLQHRSFLNGH